MLNSTRLSKMMYDIYARLIEARIDIKNNGSEGNDLVLSEISDEHCIVSKPDWFNKNGVGYSVKSIAGSIKFSVTIRENGILKMFLHTEPCFSKDGKKGVSQFGLIIFFFQLMDL